ncbi:hypothetical protein Tco_1022821, partial [Tanacetum coccineum]
MLVLNLRLGFFKINNFSFAFNPYDQIEPSPSNISLEPPHHRLWKRISDKRTKNEAKNDKTEHGMEEREKDKVKSKPKSQTVKVNSAKSTVKTGADT